MNCLDKNKNRKIDFDYEENMINKFQTKGHFLGESMEMLENKKKNIPFMMKDEEKNEILFNKQFANSKTTNTFNFYAYCCDSFVRLHHLFSFYIQFSHNQNLFFFHFGNRFRTKFSINEKRKINIILHLK